MSCQSQVSDVPDHPCGFDPKLVAKVYRRRGRLHAFENLTPKRTALVVVDLNTGSMQGNEQCQALVPRINELSGLLRDAGGRVVWVLPKFVGAEVARDVFGAETARRFEHESRREAGNLWHELKADRRDITVRKTGSSAFFPGNCDLHERLRSIDIDTILIAGTVTSVCCESSARDACELGYRVTIVFDACAGYAQEPAEVSLASFYRAFGDVRPASEIAELINRRDGRQVQS